MCVLQFVNPITREGIKVMEDHYPRINQVPTVPPPPVDMRVISGAMNQSKDIDLERIRFF